MDCCQCQFFRCAESLRLNARDRRKELSMPRQNRRNPKTRDIKKSSTKTSTKSSTRNSGQRRNKRIRFGVPRRSRRLAIETRYNDQMPPEDWYEPTGRTDGEYRVIVKVPGEGYCHVVSEKEVRARLAELPDWMLTNLDVVQLSRMTRKKQCAPLYGMQWGTTLYLYPIEASLVETYHTPPAPALVVETRMYGGTWKHYAPGTWELTWTESTIKDYYLNNILIHELGHLLDDRNSSYVDRERYAEWFAIQFGYRATQSLRPPNPKKVRRRHHAS